MKPGRLCMIGCALSGIVAVAAAGLARGQEPLYQSSFGTDAELKGWTKTDQAMVSDVARRKGTRSLLIKQWKDAEQDSQWLSPVIANPGGGPVKISFWAADDYKRQADFSYAASVDTVTTDGAGNGQQTSNYLTSLAWDDSLKWDELWGKLTIDGLVWKYYEVVTSPGAHFRLKYHWPKPLVLGDCYLTDILVTKATAADEAAAAPGKTPVAAQPAPQGNLRLELSTPVSGNLYFHDDAMEFGVLVYSHDKTDFALPADAKLTWEITDFQYFSLARGEMPFADAKPVADPAFYKSRVMEKVPGRAKNAAKTLTVEDANAKAVGQLFFIEGKLVSGGKVLASDTMPYGVVSPRKIDPADYGKCRFNYEWWRDDLHYSKSKHERQSLGDKMGAVIGYGHGEGWKQAQPVHPGPFTFKQQLPPFPRFIVPFNLEQERGQKANQISWGRTIQKQFEDTIPVSCVIDDPLHPGCPTFKIDPYVQYMVEYIRHNRDSIAMVVPSGLERAIDARTIELQKKAYTAIKKECPDLPVGMMLYGLFMNPSREKQQFIQEDLFDYADFIDDHLYASGVDWSEWEDLQQKIAKRGKKPYMISTEMCIVSGADHIARARGTILGCLDVFAHNLRSTYYFNQSSAFAAPVCREIPLGGGQDMNFMHVQLVYRPKVSPNIVMAPGRDRWDAFSTLGGGSSYMPVLQTMAYYNLVQNYEATDFRETRKPDEDSVAHVFDRRDATVVGMYMTKPVGFNTYAVKSDVAFTVQDMFGRNTRITPLDNVALISVDENPVSIIFDNRVDKFAIEQVNGGVADATMAKGAEGRITVTLPGVFTENHKLQLACAWSAPGGDTVSVRPGQSATGTLPIKIGADQTVGQYPLSVKVFDGDRLVGVLSSALSVTELLRLDVTGVPLTAKQNPAIAVTVVSQEGKPVNGVVRLDNRHFTPSLRPAIQEVFFEAPAHGKTTVHIPLDRDLVNLTASYVVPVTARTAAGKEITTQAEVSFRACEHAPGKIVVDGDLSDWKLDERTPFAMEREFTNWGQVPQGLNVKVYTLWDEKAIYFAAVVKKDSYVNEANDVGIWLSDNIHFGFYPGGWKLGEKVNRGYYREHLGLCQDDVARIFRVGNPAGGPASAVGATIAVKKVSGGYIYEWAYPKESLMPVELAEGKRFRLSMGVWGKDWLDANGKVLPSKPDSDKTAKLSGLGGLNFGCFLANVDSRPEKWREFVLTK